MNLAEKIRTFLSRPNAGKVLYISAGALVVIATAFILMLSFGVFNKADKTAVNASENSSKTFLNSTTGIPGTTNNKASDKISNSAVKTGTPDATNDPATVAPTLAETANSDVTGSDITINIGEEPRTIDPILNNSVDGAIYISHLFEGLTTIDKDLMTVPGVASSWNVSTDGMIYTFHLRDSKWSDGRPVTAYDFVYSWRHAVDPNTAADYAYQMFYLKNAEKINNGEIATNELGVKAIDANTLEVTLESQCGYFIKLTGFPTYFPLREDIVSPNPDGWSTAAGAAFVGNGPFILKTWNHDSQIIMEKSKTYWNAAAVKPAKLTFVLMSDENSILSAFKTGEIQFADTLPSDEINAMKAAGTLSIKAQLGTYYYVINTERKPYDDVRVRKALSLAIDREFIVNSITKGNQIPAGAFVPQGVPDAVPGSDFRTNGSEYIDTSASAYASNVAQAKALLADAGYPNGVGFPVIDFITNSGTGHSSIAEAIQAMWRDNLGIRMNIGTQEWAVFQQTRSDGGFDVARHGWLGDYVDPMTFLDMWTTSSGQNDSRWRNAAYDALIRTAKTSTDQTVRMTALHQAEKMLIGDSMAVIPIYYYSDLFLTAKSLHDVVYSPLGFKYFMWAYLDN